MIIGDASIDPRRVLQAEIEQVGSQYRLTITMQYGETAHSLEQFYDRYEDAAADLDKLDRAAHKGPLADAIATDRVDDDTDDDEEGRLGFV